MKIAVPAAIGNGSQDGSRSRLPVPFPAVAQRSAASLPAFSPVLPAQASHRPWPGSIRSKQDAHRLSMSALEPRARPSLDAAPTNGTECSLGRSWSSEICNRKVAALFHRHRGTCDRLELDRGTTSRTFGDFARRAFIPSPQLSAAATFDRHRHGDVPDRSGSLNVPVSQPVDAPPPIASPPKNRNASTSARNAEAARGASPPLTPTKNGSSNVSAPPRLGSEGG